LALCQPQRRRYRSHPGREISKARSSLTPTSLNDQVTHKNKPFLQQDDFYLLDSGLVVMETSLAVFKKSLYETLTPKSVPCWVRVNVANRLAKSGNTHLSALSFC